MSYIRSVKRFDFHQEISTTSQEISTTPTELNGTRFSYIPENSANTIIIQVSQTFSSTPDWDSTLQIVLQESTNNFTTFETISGSHGKVQAGGNDSNAYANGTDCWPFESIFFLDGWVGKKDFRISLRSSITQNEFTAQWSFLWNSTHLTNTYPPPLIFIKEI